MKPTLIYAYDPLCGWCFGFHPVVEKLVSRFEGKLNLKVIPGGLAIGDNVKPICEGYPYILSVIPHAEQTMGVKFGKNFKLLAEEGSYLYNSGPSCSIQNVINEMSPGHALEFAGVLQHAFFVDGRNLNEWKTFQDLLTDFPIDINTAETLYTSEKIKNQTDEGFEWCKKQGALAFPTLLLQLGKETGIMSRGYRPFGILESHLHHLLNNIQKLQA